MRELALSAPRAQGAPHVLVIGGGASGVLMATHLLAQGNGLRVTIVEAAHMLGCGLAYSTRDPDHLLNTRVGNMSAFPADPGHFLRWLRARGDGAGEQSFVSRQTYGTYLGDLLTPWQQAASPLSCLREACVDLRETATGVAARLGDGRVIAADLAVLATGHAVAARDPALVGGWQDPGPIPGDGQVVIVGSGLSMVDRALSLLNRGHRGRIVAISRRGLLPRSHADTRPLALAPGEVPFGAPVSALLRWLRRLARRAEAQGGTWRDAVDGVRPHVSALWQAMAVDQRARFLRHGVSFWEVHRHRIPPASAERIAAAMAAGQLTLRRGAFLGAEPALPGWNAVIRPPGGGTALIPAVRIIDCRGIRTDPARDANPLIAGLLARGQARIDPLHLGLDVGADCRLIGSDGRPSARIFAIGPVSKATFWEMTAIPDIRMQAAALSGGLARVMAAG